MALGLESWSRCGQSSWNSSRQSPFLTPLGLLGLGAQVGPDDQVVHVGPHEAGVGVLGLADDGLTPDVERGVDDHRAAALLAEGVDHRVVARVVVGVDGLDPGRVVDVGDGGDRRPADVELVDAKELLLLLGHRGAAIFPDRRHQQHVGALAVDLEVVRHVVVHHRRGKGSERLAELDLQVHDRLHLLGARIADDAARAKGPGTELHASLKPADDVLVGDQLGDALGKLSSSSRRWYLAPKPSSTRRIWASLKPGPIVRALLGPPRRGGPRPLLEVHVPGHQRRSQSTSGVARGGLDPQVLERTLAQDPAVAHAVERHTPRHAEVLLTRNLVDMAGHTEHGFLTDHLRSSAPDPSRVGSARIRVAGAVHQTGRGTCRWSSAGRRSSRSTACRAGTSHLP